MVYQKNGMQYLTPQSVRKKNCEQKLFRNKKCSNSVFCVALLGHVGLAKYGKVFCCLMVLWGTALYLLPNIAAWICKKFPALFSVQIVL